MRTVRECVVDIGRRAALAVVDSATCRLIRNAAKTSDTEERVHITMSESPPDRFYDASMPPWHDESIVPVFFEGSDVILNGPRRLPCDFEGSLLVTPEGIASTMLPAPIEIPLSRGLSRLRSFEELHFNFIVDDFRRLCDTYSAPESKHREHQRARRRETNDQNSCVTALIKSLDKEIAMYCPLRLEQQAKEQEGFDSDDSTGNTALSMAAVVAPRVSLEHSPVLHVRLLSGDSDLQRFYHFFLAEVLPVLSLAQRMMKNRSNIAKALQQRYIVVHAEGRKWGSNPLHSAFRDLLKSMGKSLLIKLVDDVEVVDDDAHTQVLLPRWDWAWWENDRNLAKDAIRFIKNARPFREALASSTRRRLLMVFQLRESDPALISYCRC